METPKQIRAERASVALSRWAIDRAGPRQAVAKAAGVSISRASHWMTDDPKNPVARTCEMVMGSPHGRAIVAAVEAAWERAPLLRESTSRLLSRWHFLKAKGIELGLPAGATVDRLLDIANAALELSQLSAELVARGVPEGAIE